MPQPNNAAAPGRAETLVEAVNEAARLMGLSQADVARILGISEASASRMVRGEWAPRENSSQWQLALLLIRLFRSLDAIMAGDETALQAWLRNDNRALGAPPYRLIQSVEGLARTLAYVDSYRACA